MSTCSRLLGAAALLSLVACGGTDVGNGRTRLNLLGYEQAPTNGTQSLTLASGVRIESLHLAVARIRLQPGPNCETEDAEVDLDRVLVADLVGAGALNPPEERQWPIQGDTFCELRLDFHRLELGEPVPAGTPPELVDLTMRVVGEREDGVGFVVESQLGEQLELESSAGPFRLPAGSALILGFELSSWIASLDLGSLGAGPIVVSKDVNADRLSAFEDAVETSIRLFADADADDALSPDEHAPGEELAD